MNSKIFKTLIIVLLIAAAFSCSSKKMKETATGKISEIAVCSPLPVYGAVESQLIEYLYEEVMMPVRESVFSMRFVSEDEYGMYIRSKNLLVLINLSKTDSYTEKLKAMLEEDQIEQVRKNKAMILEAFDGYANGQNILIIAGVDDDAIKSIIDAAGENLKDFFIYNSYRPLEMMVYFTGEKKKLSSDFYKYIGLKIKVPSDFVESFHDSVLRAYSVISHNPDRVVTAGILDTDEEFSVNTMISYRNKLGEAHWQGDFVDTSFVPLKVDTVTILGNQAIEVMGVWSNDSSFYGGPFVAYLMKEADRLVYMDGHIYLPGERKFFKLMETRTILLSAFEQEEE